MQRGGGGSSTPPNIRSAVIDRKSIASTSRLAVPVDIVRSSLADLEWLCGASAHDLRRWLLGPSRACLR
jgi:hypothetical protein